MKTMLLNKFITLLLIVLTINSNVFGSIIDDDRANCIHAVCPGNFECPSGFYFYRRDHSCCYDCTYSCDFVQCQNITSCPGDGNYLIPAGGRFCCDHCNHHPYF